MKILDLFCGAGGAGMGYHRAGFTVTGVDIAPQPRYPFAFIQGDALQYVCEHWQQYDAIHASPPCQRFSSMTKTAGTQNSHPDLIAPARVLLRFIGLPYVIENVAGAPLHNALMLCGTMFGLDVIRHRYFEMSHPIYFTPPCQHLKPVVRHGRPVDLQTHYHGVTGHFSGVPEARQAMGIDWMTQGELAESIPPAYTEFIGKQLMRHLLVKGELA